ncbi:MAG: 3-methyl-2-oxobutanoate dehydrogenase subunit VorB [Actinobacteria bacterium]|nr:3-methyl-2-oxobutanoate dehydrogenase subunit VorB [Actinomycetota bacterium]
MGEKQLFKGNEAIAEAAIRAGCRYYFGYPITPQNEIPEYMSRRMPKIGGVFLQAESEIAAINMVFGAGGSGVRVMTTTSSPGISLMQEGISYLAGAEIPCVIVNVMRGGPGLGGIQPAQSDYFQATKGGGHGDYHCLVLGPSTLQELVEFVFLAFDLADKYRNPVIILTDGVMGQMMEPVEFPPEVDILKLSPKEWATTGAKGRKKIILKSLYLDPLELENHNLHLQEKYNSMQEEIKWEEMNTKDCDLLLVAYGTAARVSKKAIEVAKEKNLSLGIFRPITLYPFPYIQLKDVIQNKKIKNILVVEMSMGQMIEDVKLAVEGEAPVGFYGRTGGVMPKVDEIIEKAESILKVNTLKGVM